MNLRKIVILSLAGCAICIALTAADKSPARTGDSPQGKGMKVRAGQENVIGFLEMRGKTITITRESNGTFYTIKSKDGKTLAAKLKEKDLQARFPEIYNQVKFGLAGNDATLRPRVYKF